jgi:hypothetical protein
MRFSYPRTPARSIPTVVRRKGKKSDIARRGVAGFAATLLGLALVPAVGLVGPAAPAQAAPVGADFQITPADLAFILKQIKIAEHHAQTFTADDPCRGLVGNGPNQIPSPLVSYGLRTVDGSCNNLIDGQAHHGAADQVFPRLTKPVFKSAQPATFDPDGPGPAQVGDATTYASKSGAVFDSEPRTISNLIVDQTSSNPAAVAAAGSPVRTQGNEGVVPCQTDPVPGTPGTPGVPAGCITSHQTLPIPILTSDVGLSPPLM